MDMPSLRKELQELQDYYQQPPATERLTCHWIIVPLLHAMGYKPRDITPELHDQDGKYPDYGILCEQCGKTWYLEAKAWHVRLEDSHVRQATNYANHNGSRWVVLSNGRYWRVYDDSVTGLPDDKLVMEAELSDIDAMLRLLGGMSKDSVLEGSIEEFANRERQARRQQRTQERVNNFLKAQLSDPDSALIGVVTAFVRETGDIPEASPNLVGMCLRGVPASVVQPRPQIYASHAADHESTIYAAFSSLVASLPDVMIDKRGSRYIFFAPHSWEFFQAGGSTKWTGSQRTLLYSLEYKNDSGNPDVMVRLFIGPAQDERRRSLFDLARSHQPPLRLARNLMNRDWDRIYQIILASGREIADCKPQELLDLMTERWNAFVDADFGAINLVFCAGMAPPGTTTL